MSAELAPLLDAVPAGAPRNTYRTAVVDDNVLGKRTGATRKLSFQRLTELYALDPSVALFRYMRFLWSVDRKGRPLIAFLTAYARDPLLRMTAPAVLGADQGSRVATEDIEKVIAGATLDRLNPSVRNKVARNAGSSWTQSGHLRGRARKHRVRPNVTAGAAAMALFLGYLQGLRATRLFDSEWTRVLDATRDRLNDLAREAARHGWLNHFRAGDVVEVRFPGRLTADEEGMTHEPN